MGMENLRDTLEENKTAVMIGAGVLILLSIVLLVIRMSGGGSASLGTASKVIYYDVDQKTISLVEHDMGTGPAPSPKPGSESVFIAAVWYCGDSGGAEVSDGMSLDELESKGFFIGWLEKDDPETKPDEYNTRPMMFRTLDNPTWVKGETAASLKIIEGPLNKCADAAQYVAD